MQQPYKEVGNTLILTISNGVGLKISCVRHISSSSRHLHLLNILHVPNLTTSLGQRIFHGQQCSI